MNLRYLYRIASVLLILSLLLLPLLTSCGKGDKGDKGEQGISIIKTELVDGELIVTYSDGRKENLGTIPGESDPNVSALDFYPLPDGTYGVKAGNIDYIEEVIVPASYKGRRVSRILNSAFKGYSNLRTVHLPESLTAIGEGAFLDCNGLRSIEIPEGVTEIGNFAFQRCTKLTSVTLPSTLEQLGQTAFLDCVRLAEVINRSSLALEAGSAEQGCVARYALLIHSDPTSRLVTEGEYLFCSTEQIHALIDYLGDDPSPVLPKNFKGNSYEINDYAFNGYKSLTSIQIPDGVTRIGASAFEGCSALTAVTLPESLTVIGARAFANCEKLDISTLPGNLISIGENAFLGTALYLREDAWEDLVLVVDGYLLRARDTISDHYTVPDSVRLIADGAFSSCIELTKIKIPKTLQYIGVRSFSHCRKLDRLEYGGTQAQWEALTKSDDWSYGMGFHTIVCTDGSITPSILG